MANYNQNPYGMQFPPPQNPQNPPPPPFGQQMPDAASYASFWGFPPALGQNGIPMPPPPAFTYPANSFFPPPPLSAAPPYALAAPQRALPLAPPNIPVANNRITEITVAEKEEGELSEGDRVTQSPASQPTDGTGHLRSATQKLPASSVPAPKIGQRRDTSLNKLSAAQRNSTLGPNNSTRSLTSSGEPTAPRGSGLDDPTLATNSSGNLARQGDTKAAPREEAKSILTLLYANGFGYQELTREHILDVGRLREMYQEMGVPVPVPATMPPKIPALAAVPPKVPPSLVPAKRPHPLPAVPPKIMTPQAPAPAKTVFNLPPKPVLSTASVITRNVSTTSIASPVDRKEYLARLQAARSGKTQNPAKEPQRESPGTPVVDLAMTDVVSTAEPKKTPQNAVVIFPSATTMSSKTNGVEPVKAAEKNKAITELARQKLAALTDATKASSSAVTPLPASAVVSTNATPGPPSRASSLSSAMYGSGQEHVQAEASASHSNIHPRSSGSTADTTIPKPPNISHQDTRQLTSPPTWTPSSSGIPGLFMAGSSPSHGTSRQTPVQRAPSQQRQLPPPPSTPFGQPRHESREECIIDVSDDETETVISGMDIDEEAGPRSSLASQNNADQRRAKEVARNLPRLSGFPSPAANAKQAASGFSTPPAVQTPGSQVSQAELKRKEEEIAAMHRRIAEIERRKAANKGKQLELSRPATPAAKLPVATEAVVSTPANVDRPTQDETPQTSIAVAPLGLVSSTLPLVPATISTLLGQDAKQKSPAPGSSEWKRTRRAEIESGLPSLEARLAIDAARLEQMKKDMELLQFETRRRIEDKANLVRELESLGTDTEGMTHAELQARKDEIVQQREMGGIGLRGEVVTSNHAVSPTQASTSDLSVAPVTDAALHGLNLIENDRPVEVKANTPEEAPASSPDVDMVMDEHKEEKGSRELQTPANRDHLAPSDDLPTSTPGRGPVLEEPVEHPVVSPAPADLAIDDQGSESDDMDISDVDSVGMAPIIQNASGSAAVSPYPSGAVTSPEDVEDFYSPEPVDERPSEDLVVKHHVPITAESLTATQPLDSSGGSDIQEEPLDVAVGQKETERGMENDDMGMGDQDAPLQAEGKSPQMQLESLHPLETAPHDGVDTMMSSSSDAGDDYEPTEFISQASHEHDDSSIAVADNLASEVQATSAPTTQEASSFALVQQEILSATVSDPGRKPANALVALAPFVPYESPLRYFKSYRNHKNYTSDVPGGYRSMTFSHQIDADKQLCNFEAVGGRCNDAKCAFQHFRDMELSAGMILVQLGTANPGKTDEEKQQFKDGLKSIIRDLRSKKTEDPEIIAGEFSNYRRHFLQDDTRVVNVPE